MILDVAMRLALKDGLSAMTVRRIATEAQISTGQVHHHFKSASHLKAEVFTCLMNQLTMIEKSVETDNWYTKISISLGCEDIQQVQPYLKLWNEAEVILAQDEEIQKAYNLTMEQWHTSIKDLIELGVVNKEYVIQKNTNSTDIAWRLITFVCGLENICNLGLRGLDHDMFQRHIEYIIRNELFN